MPFSLHVMDPSGIDEEHVYGDAEVLVDDFLKSFHVHETHEWWLAHVNDKGRLVDSAGNFLNGGGFEEFEGKLYYQSMDYSHDEYAELFKGSPKDKPHTIAELRQFLLDGCELELGWAERGQAYFALVNLPVGESYWAEVNVRGMIDELSLEDARALDIEASVMRQILALEEEEICAIDDRTCYKTALSSASEKVPTDLGMREVMAIHFERPVMVAMGGHHKVLQAFLAANPELLKE